MTKSGVATRRISLLTVLGSGLVLVDPGVEDRPVDHLWFLGVSGGLWGCRLAPRPGKDLWWSSSADHEAELGGVQQVSVGFWAGVFAGFGAVEVVRRVGGFTGWGGSVKEACKLLWDVAPPALLWQCGGGGGRGRGRRRVPLVRPVVCKEDTHTHADKKNQLLGLSHTAMWYMYDLGCQETILSQNLNEFTQEKKIKKKIRDYITQTTQESVEHNSK